MSERIQMSQKIRDQIEEVRKEGRFNMFDRDGVQVAANDLELYDLVVFIEDIGRVGWGKVIMGEIDVIADDEEDDVALHSCNAANAEEAVAMEAEEQGERVAGEHADDGGFFRRLAADEDAEFRAWARANHAIGHDEPNFYHPVVRDECAKMDAEARA